jgi:hypothetical protein
LGCEAEKIYIFKKLPINRLGGAMLDDRTERYNLRPVLNFDLLFKQHYMLKLAPVFFLIVLALSVYSLYATTVMPKIFLFSAIMLLFISLLGKKRVA